jgi:hypothetical protein
MRNRHVKSAPIIITGALLSGLAVVEEREPYHIEQRQYQEPSKLTYEISLSTASGTVGTFLINPFDRDRWT